jgi:hypothetical protein
MQKTPEIKSHLKLKFKKKNCKKSHLLIPRHTPKIPFPLSMIRKKFHYKLLRLARSIQNLGIPEHYN